MPLDIGLGLLAGALFHHLTGIPLLTSGVLAVGFVLLPDVDAVVQVLRRGGLRKMSADHRDLLHRPLLYVPIGTALAWLLADWRIAALFCVMSLAHFLHDSIGTGWGVAWLRPLTRNYYKFFSLDEGDASVTTKRLLVSWTPEQQRAVAARYGNPNWLRDMYLSPQKPYLRLLLVEVAVLAAGAGLIAFLLGR